MAVDHDLDSDEDESFPLLAPSEADVCYALTQWDKDLAKLLKANPTVGIADFAVELTNRLRIARGLAAENIRRTQEHMAEQSAENDREYDFKEGDRVWLAVPLRPATGELRNTKFLFKWAGPMRIVGREGEKFKLIEVIPGGSIIPRIANRGLMRPNTPRRPVDKAEKAAAEAADDYEQELEKWLKDFNVLYKRPPGREEASGVNKWFRQRFDEDYDPELDLEDPQYEIEKITKVRLDAGPVRYYEVKFKGWNNTYNLWYKEHDLPKNLDNDFWGVEKGKQSTLYNKYVTHIEDNKETHASESKKTSKRRGRR
ncbi:hypothetical protein HDU96_004500 [Phlyctochytrium bullatum]|nr:hypothetical protein HDU96_004500 [Phlyctochytrium bullatum]